MESMYPEKQTVPETTALQERITPESNVDIDGPSLQLHMRSMIIEL